MATASSQRTTTTWSSSSTWCRGGPGTEILAQVKVHPLVHHTRADVPLPDALDACRLVAGLFQKLSLGGLVGRLAGVDRPGGHFEQRSTDRVAAVLDQADVIRVDHRDQGDRPPMEDHLPLGDRPVAERYLLQGQVDLSGRER